VCQIPDYRKISPATHAELVTTLYGFLMRQGTIPVDWFARQVDQADQTSGDIDTLSNRIAHIRTWTFAANRPDWLADPEHWQGITRAVEDRLSDALHERLTERFVDRRTSVLMRRLRENAVLDAEISKSGEVVVEGHAIGRLDGFTFTPDSSSVSSEAKALAGAAQKALAGEINARATRLAQAADGQLVLATDGTIRWLGQPVGKLVAGEDALKPRLRIIADEHLTGAPRDAVQARLDLWLKSHIERLLEALFRLAAAEDVTGIARGVAFQLTEALGVLDRQKVAEEVKGLDQPTRATLRKYGVRFGAYHVYIPALLKPGPRVLATQLWALKHGSAETKGLEEVTQLAASGRTSIAANKDISKVLYRIAGYRICGGRAVRVDMLERLADLIRPALAWRAGTPGAMPPGAVDGFGFTVTVGMTSLVGCSGDDFASVLRALGYRMEKRPRASEAASPAFGEPPPADSQPATETARTKSAGEDEAHAATAEPTIAADAVEAPQPDPEPAAADPAAQAAASEAGEPHELQPPPLIEETVVNIPEAPALAVSLPAELERKDAVAADRSVDAASRGEEFIEVWRPGRREANPRKPRHARALPARRSRTTTAPSAGTAAVETAPPIGETAPASAGAVTAVPSPSDQRRDRRERRGQAAGGGRSDRQQRSRRPDRRDSQQRADRPDRPGRQPRDERPDRDPALRAKYIKGRADRHEREPDPNSPFAKLAALKEQLEASSKEPR
jgi:ATP-dependent RNA helicase SUPV3L1/SUV3